MTDAPDKCPQCGLHIQSRWDCGLEFGCGSILEYDGEWHESIACDQLSSLAAQLAEARAEGERLRALIRPAWEHVNELRDAWMKGAIHERERDRLKADRRTLARLAAKGPAFFNPLEARAAENLRDSILWDECGMNPDGTPKQP